MLGHHTNASIGRYSWDSANKILYGPFGSGELAVYTAAGEIFGQFQQAYTETCGKSETFSAWTPIGGASVTSDQTAAPDTGKLADKLTFGAAATDGIKIALGSVTDDKNQAASVFVRTLSGTKQFRLQFLLKDGTTATSGDLTATDSWDRFDFTADILAGATTPEIRVINDSGGNAGDIYIFGANVHKDSAFPYGYFVNETGGDLICAKDEFFWDAADVPAVMHGGSGKWVVKAIPFFAHDETSTWSMIAANNRGDGTSYLAYGTDNKVRLIEGGVIKRLSNALTFPGYAHLTIIVDNDANSIIVAGADTGDGTVVGTAYAWDTSKALYWGCWNGGGIAQQFNGRLSEPKAP